MITFSDIDFDVTNLNAHRTAVAFVINSEVVETLAIYTWAFDLMKNADTINDVSSEYPDLSSEEIVVQFMQGGIETERFKCYEMLGAILLSNPEIVAICSGQNIEEISSSPHQYWSRVAPGWTYSNGAFTLPGYYE